MTAQVASAHISDVMSTPALTVETGESLWDAWHLMFVSGIRHLVIVDANGMCVGVLSDRNIVSEIPATPEHLGARKVCDVFSASPELRVHPADDPRAAAAMMQQHGVEAVPVVDEKQRLVGVVTESDLVRWLAP